MLFIIFFISLYSLLSSTLSFLYRILIIIKNKKLLHRNRSGGLGFSGYLWFVCGSFRHNMLLFFWAINIYQQK